MDKSYTIEQILDAITQASEKIAYALEYEDREMLQEAVEEHLD